jgi:tRNA-dihydrouridine synthase
MDPCTVSVAPMMDWTDKHCRYFFRLLSTCTQLFSGDRASIVSQSVSYALKQLSGRF